MANVLRKAIRGLEKAVVSPLKKVATRSRRNVKPEMEGDGMATKKKAAKKAAKKPVSRKAPAKKAAAKKTAKKKPAAKKSAKKSAAKKK
jgi:ribonuclease E